MSHLIRLIGHQWKMCLIIECKAVSGPLQNLFDLIFSVTHNNNAQSKLRLYYLRAYNSNNLVLLFANATSQVKLTGRQTGLRRSGANSFITATPYACNIYRYFMLWIARLGNVLPFNCLTPDSYCIGFKCLFIWIGCGPHKRENIVKFLCSSV